MAQKEWRTVDTGQMRHVVELVHGGQAVFYCVPIISHAEFSVRHEPITATTVFTCLWCAAWWEP